MVRLESLLSFDLYILKVLKAKLTKAISCAGSMDNFTHLLKKEDLLQTLIQWSSINTYSLNIEGLDKQLDLLQKAFKPLSDLCEIKELEPTKKLTEDGTTLNVPLGKALLLKKRAKAKKQIFISGHYDTVFPASSSFQKPERCGDVLVGPGVMDMKGGLLILKSALHAFELFAEKEELGWTLLIAPDEEIGSPGSSLLIDKYCQGAKVGIAMEPCLPNGNLISKRKGSLNFNLSASGKAAHAGRAFDEGENAIYKLLPFLQWCSENKIQDSDINLGMILGGGPLNVVPDHAQVGICMRSFNPEGFKEIKDKVSEHKALKYLELSYRPPKPFDAKSQALFQIYKECSEGLGLPLNFSESGGVCDGNNIAAHGIPTIDTVGAMGGGIHSHEEFIKIDSLESKAKVLFLFLTKLARMPLDELP